VVGLYVDGFFATPELEARVRESFLSSLTITPPTLLLSAPVDTEFVHGHLIERVPVYYGSPQTNAYDSKGLASLQRDMMKAIPWRKGIEGLRYGLLGRVTLFEQPKVVAYVLHIWGPNLESTTTFDAKEMLIGGRLHRFAYDLEMEATLKMIAYEPVVGAIHLPTIGLWAFLGALSDPDRKYARGSFWRALAKAAECEPRGIFRPPEEINVYVYDTVNRPTKPLPPNVVVHLGKTKGDLFSVTFDPDRPVTIVNAWDSNSFIGNGGKNDPTIDGLLVARESKLSNDAFLHNAAFWML
jgi:hypothetical protein